MNRQNRVRQTIEAWSKGYAQSHRSILTDGSALYSYGHRIGYTTKQGARVALCCTATATTAHHASFASKLANYVVVCPEHPPRAEDRRVFAIREDLDTWSYGCPVCHALTTIYEQVRDPFDRPAFCSSCGLRVILRLNPEWPVRPKSPIERGGVTLSAAPSTET